MINIFRVFEAKWNKFKKDNVNIDELLELDQDKYKERIVDARDKATKLRTEIEKLILTQDEFKGRMYKASRNAKAAAEKGDEIEARKFIVKKQSIDAELDTLINTIESLRSKETIIKDKVDQMESALDLIDVRNTTIKAQLSAAEVSESAAEMLTGMGDDSIDMNDVMDLAKTRTIDLEARANALTNLADEGFLSVNPVQVANIDENAVTAELDAIMGRTTKVIAIVPEE